MFRFSILSAAESKGVGSSPSLDLHNGSKLAVEFLEQEKVRFTHRLISEQGPSLMYWYLIMLLLDYLFNIVSLIFKEHKWFYK